VIELFFSPVALLHEPAQLGQEKIKQIRLVLIGGKAWKAN